AGRAVTLARDAQPAHPRRLVAAAAADTRPGRPQTRGQRRLPPWVAGPAVREPPEPPGVELALRRHPGGSGSGCRRRAGPRSPFALDARDRSGRPRPRPAADVWARGW